MPAAETPEAAAVTPVEPAPVVTPAPVATPEPERPDYATLLKDLPDEEFEALERVKQTRDRAREQAARDQETAVRASEQRAEAQRALQQESAAFRRDL